MASQVIGLKFKPPIGPPPCFFIHVYHQYSSRAGRSGLMDKVSTSQPWNRGFESHMGHDHDYLYDTSTGWFQEADLRVM